MTNVVMTQTECTCTPETGCGEGSQAGCDYCRRAGCYEPCPVFGFMCDPACGDPDEPCCTWEQRLMTQKLREGGPISTTTR